ncbi:hypothetical protein HID58_048081 [Brassica napus]|uniref:Uncharacterized protein n=1 Tax=Brassica napus TaxID=3708 RepID=A0ABQ8B1F6_BRANA|nr:hypothetical protein HID58_048081 [Brassica napus]
MINVIDVNTVAIYQVRYAVIYDVWNERNRRIHDGTTLPAGTYPGHEHVSTGQRKGHRAFEHKLRHWFGSSYLLDVSSVNDTFGTQISNQS